MLSRPCKIFEYPGDEAITLEHVIERVHPDDLARLLDARPEIEDSTDAPDLVFSDRFGQAAASVGSNRCDASKRSTASPHLYMAPLRISPNGDAPNPLRATSAVC
jgi:hypothetical protein